MPSRHTPKYRHYKPKDLGMVVLDGHALCLGKYDSPESRERYHRLIAEFHSRGVATASNAIRGDVTTVMTVNELILALCRIR